MNRILQPVQCTSGKASLNKSLPLWKVSLILCRRESMIHTKENSSSSELNGEGGHVYAALVVSGNHMLIDCHSFYRVYNMLSNEEQVRSLNYMRKWDVYDNIAKAVKHEEYYEDKLLAGFKIMRNIKGVLLSVFPESFTRVFYANDQWIKKQKSKSTIKERLDPKDVVNVPFVSTNDILTSEVSKCMSVYLCLGSTQVMVDSNSEHLSQIIYASIYQ